LKVYADTLAGAARPVKGLTAGFQPKAERTACCGCGAFTPA
jgi:hypothetical protein